MTRLCLLPALVALAAPLPAQLAAPLGAQQPAAATRDDAAFSFYDRGPYRPQVPRPDSLLGYAIGEMNTQYAQQERVLLGMAAAASDRVRVEAFATSAEGRTMRLYVVTAPENLQRLDAIRADLDALADPRGRTTAQLDALAERTPAVVMLSFSVHGNESPGFEAAMPVLYQLAASTEPATLDMLRRTIVVINPSSNPDGHERFAVWYNSVGVRDPDPESLEHDEPWSVQGRYNHYRFDMNRDVIASTQREVQGLLRAMLRWHPVVAVDLHGMTEQYFFPPAARPVNANIGAASAKWLEAIGRGNAAAFDRFGWLYYVRDVFDLYYPGYWDTWPALTGATGMTYETDGGGWKGILWRRDDGSLLSFRDGIAKHHVAALATIATTAARAGERVRDYVRFRQEAVASGRDERMKRVLFAPGNDPAAAADLALALGRAGIEVRRANEAFTSGRAVPFDARVAAGGRRFEAGTYVVDLAQPQGRLARAILEPVPAIDSAFASAQLAKFRRNARRGPQGQQEGYEFYDITAWSLPVAFGVEAWYTEDAGDVRGELLPAPPGGPVAGVPLLDSVRVPASVGGGVTGGAQARSAYVFGPERSGATPLAVDLMRQGVRVAVATQPIDAGGRRWPRGTYVVRVSRNDSTLFGRVDRLARARGVEVAAIGSAFADSGQY
ncbi:MAG TPA: M14 family zinc carboxypeptidase, partial [Gemmatimonadaceae bacterium]|nr:M14 family zinc carboxypeptidase [Gemmatimonadaceae bacterium]